MILEFILTFHFRESFLVVVQVSNGTTQYGYRFTEVMMRRDGHILWVPVNVNFSGIFLFDVLG